VRRGTRRPTAEARLRRRLVGLLLALPLAGEAAVSCPPLAGYEDPRPGDVSEANRRKLAPDIERVAKQHRLEPALLHALIAAESGFNPVAVSPDGAIGLMQLMPVTAREYGEAALCDPVANLETGAAHFARLLRKYRNISHAIAAYNAGEGTMQNQRRRVTYLETRKFVVRAINFYWRYKGSAKP
jgi:soluble lytic murein transglycosylase-like protein